MGKQHRRTNRTRSNRRGVVEATHRSLGNRRKTGRHRWAFLPALHDHIQDRSALKIVLLLHSYRYCHTCSYYRFKGSFPCVRQSADDRESGGRDRLQHRNDPLVREERSTASPFRTEGGHRLYTSDMVGRLVFIRRSRELGFSMNEIRQLPTLVDGEQVSCERVKAIADEHSRDIRSKIADLRRGPSAF